MTTNPPTLPAVNLPEASLGQAMDAPPRRAWDHAVAALIKAHGDHKPRPKLKVRNPKPPGVFLPGSASEVVLALLKKHQGLHFRREQIVRLTGRTEKAVDWALLFLRTHGAIVATHDLPRNSKYMRYRVPPTEQEKRNA